MSQNTLTHFFEQAAKTYDNSSILAQETEQEMLTRLPAIRVNPKYIIDLGCATASGAASLKKHFKDTSLFGLDQARNMLLEALKKSRIKNAIQAEVTALPIKNECIDFVWSNLLLHWVTNHTAFFREIKRILNQESGLFYFSFLGSNSYPELQQAGVALPEFPTIQETGDQLQAAGFSNITLDSWPITFSYQNPRNFMKDLREVGTRNELLKGANYRECRDTLKRLKPSPDSSFEVTHEVVYGIAWKGPAINTTAKNHKLTNEKPISFFETR